MTEREKEISEALQAPFHPDEVGWKPQVFTQDKKKAMAVPFVDARSVAARLDDVLGPFNWKTELSGTPDGQIKCRLSIRGEDGEWVCREDVGSKSDQPDAGDQLKAAASDALKRSAVQLGIARYLYSVPQQWVEIDQWKKFTRTPTLPAWALPKTKIASPKGTNGQHTPTTKEVEEEESLFGKALKAVRQASSCNRLCQIRTRYAGMTKEDISDADCEKLDAELVSVFIGILGQSGNPDADVQSLADTVKLRCIPAKLLARVEKAQEDLPKQASKK